MSEMLSKVVDSAKRDRGVAKMLRKIAKLDAKLMPSGVVLQLERFGERGNVKQAQKLSNLCDRVAQKIMGSGEDAEEMAMWISYNYQQVVRELDTK